MKFLTAKRTCVSLGPIITWLLVSESPLRDENVRSLARHRWIRHVFRHDGLLHEIIAGRMTGEPSSIDMLHEMETENGCQKSPVYDIRLLNEWMTELLYPVSMKCCTKFRIDRLIVVEMEPENQQCHYVPCIYRYFVFYLLQSAVVGP